MGFIRAAKNAIGGVLRDSWKDCISCENLEDPVLLVKKTTDTGVITKNARIIVNAGQVALFVNNGVVTDATAEPGVYTFDASSAPALFGGEFDKGGVGGTLKSMWERFTYGGMPTQEQAIYFVNIKEIMGNRFGTPAPIPYKDWGHPNFNPRTNALYSMSVNIKAFGSFTFRISDPFAFLSNVAGTAQRYVKENLEDQIRSEFISVFKNTLAELGSDSYKIEAMDLPHKDDEIIEAMQAKRYDARILERGVSILSIAVESIRFDEESQKKINDYELSDAYTQSGYLAGATGRAMESAATNAGGASVGFIGMNMAQQASPAGGQLGQMMENQTAVQQGMAQQGAKTPQQVPSAETNVSRGNTVASLWICSCGHDNKGKFCAECGGKKPIEQPIYRCDKCGWTPADPTKLPKFCPECGDPFTEADQIN